MSDNQSKADHEVLVELAADLTRQIARALDEPRDIVTERLFQAIDGIRGKTLKSSTDAREWAGVGIVGALRVVNDGAPCGMFEVMTAMTLAGRLVHVKYRVTVDLVDVGTDVTG